MSAQVLGIADGRALGGSLRVIVTDPRSLASARSTVDGVVAAMDVAASRFRGDSELARVNGSPGTAIRVSPLLAQAIEAALRGARLTDGAVDPTVGHALRLAGYDTDFASVPPSGEPLRLVAEAVPGWRAVRFDAATRTVCVPRGVELDLGATAKALTADLAAAAAIRILDAGGVLVSLGGDVAVAGAAPSGGWLIQASEDSGAAIDEDEETVAIRTGGVATSSTTVRRWRRGQAELHHIIDPATGLPAQGPWRTATVAAGSCVDANIASTAAIVLGDRAPAWLDRHRMAARLVGRDGRVVRLAGWPEPKPAPRIL
jgi:thiamine biosynthesis lipoprotein